MLSKFFEIMKEADELVAHNGDKFDLKWLNTRFLIHEIGAMEDWKTVDTLAIARRRFNFNSNRLDYIGEILFGEGKKDSGGFQTWVDIVLHNDREALKRMVKYCKQDVLLLEKVFYALEKYHKPKTHVGVLDGHSRWTCPYTGSSDVFLSKTRVSTAGTKRYQMHCKSSGAYYTIPESVYKQYLEERHKDENQIQMEL